MRSIRLRVVWCLCLSVLTLGFDLASAIENTPLTVLYVGKQTVSASPYYQEIQEAADKKGSDRADVLSEADRALDRLPPTTPSQVSQAQFFPLKTTRLKPGQPSEISIEGMITPLFVIGMDPGSMAWLEREQVRLAQMGAIGIVVEAPSFASFNALRARAEQQGLHLDIGFGDPLADGFSVDVYPVLIKGAAAHATDTTP